MEPPRALTAIDTSRPPIGELAARSLVDAIVATDDRAERHYLEIKGTLDLTTKKDQAKIAKFILGSANRMPSLALKAFAGYGVMVIGASQDSMVGVPPIEALEIHKAVRPFIGADGPQYDLVRVPVANSDNEILILLVDPPKEGQGPFICRKNGDGLLRDGAVFIRADGETREARGDELRQLIERGQANMPQVDFDVQVMGVVQPVIVNDDLTVNAYITLNRKNLELALRESKSVVIGGRSATVAQSPVLAAAMSRAHLTLKAFQEPEPRTEDEYMAEIDDWEKRVREQWPSAIKHLIGALLDPVELEVANRTKTFLHDVELKVHLEGPVIGIDSVKSSKDVDSLTIPPVPRLWGPQLRPIASLRNNLDALTYGATTFASRVSPRTTWHNSESIDWEFSVGKLRPRGTEISSEQNLVLVTFDQSLGAVHGTWEITARDHHDVYSGTLAVKVGKPLDLTNRVRSILGLDSTNDG